MIDDGSYERHIKQKKDAVGRETSDRGSRSRRREGHTHTHREGADQT